MDGRSLYIPRGKTLGGSSSMNAMLYVRGRPLDYDLWEAGGATGWGWEDVLPYFLRSEDNARGASEFHGAGGELRISEQRSPRPLTARLLAASEAAGIPRIADYNGPEQDGVVDVPGHAAQRPPVEHRRRLPAPGDEAPEPRGDHGRARRSASSSRATARPAFATATGAGASRSPAPSAR